MVAKNTQFATLLRQHKLSVTTARKAVFEALCKHEQLSMRALCEACPEIDRASVYRTISLFESLHIAQRVYTGWKYRIELGEAFREHHHHALCTACGGYTHLPEDEQLEQQIISLAEQHGFKTSRRSLELQGICKACYEKSDH